MKKNYLLLLVALVCSIACVQAQKTEIKYYPKTSKAGEAGLLYSYGEYRNGISSKLYVIDVPRAGSYYLNSLANMELAQTFKVYVDKREFEKLPAEAKGWQLAAVKDVPMQLSAGIHEIRFEGVNAMVPMTDELFLSASPLSANRENIPANVQSFLNKVKQLQSMPVPSSFGNGNDGGELISKVLPNPEGEYSHAIDTAFVYSHYSVVYLAAGNYTITTSGSTISRALAVFSTASFNQSFSNVNSGPGGESSVKLTVSTPGYYAIMLRPTSSGASGTTDILINGSTFVSGAVIDGKFYSTPALRGGDLNYFTCKITGDTRIFTSRFPSSSIRGYNDDYYGGNGNWIWNLASRIKKNFNGSDSVQYTFVCAYSPTSTGICDIYMGCGNSNLPVNEPQNFPNLPTDDAIRSAPQTGSYNCISWSGGITTSWIWPPSSLSTYNCNSNNYLLCFDNYYSNNPVRYPGAWNYTRTGATAANSVVDLWKTASAYTHASVFEPGNNHPHGYDWESKPGGLDRTFHPRNALSNPNWYGSVSNYYRSTGTFARAEGMGNEITSDADAIKAGLAILDKAMLSDKANEKLSGLLGKVKPAISGSFDMLYEKWDATKEANASFSNPSMYCQNKEYKALEAFALANRYASMLIVFDKFIKGDHLIGDLLLTLTTEKYGRLLDEVKTERLANLYDKEGHYRLHGDHDNGVLYIEKILKQLEPEPEAILVSDLVSIVVSPNPVKDRLTVQVTTLKTARVFVKAISTQTLLSKVLQAETELPAGTHRFSMDVQGFAGNTGDIIAVQVIIDGQLKTVKVLVAK